MKQIIQSIIAVCLIISLLHNAISALTDLGKYCKKKFKKQDAAMDTEFDDPEAAPKGVVI